MRALGRPIASGPAGGAVRSGLGAESGSADHPKAHLCRSHARRAPLRDIDTLARLSLARLTTLDGRRTGS
jgi:hypothetical protein